MKLAELNRATQLTDEVIDAADDLFKYHPWEREQVEAGEKVRDSLQIAYMTIIKNVPSCPTRTRALNMLIDARMLANAAITFKGEV